MVTKEEHEKLKVRIAELEADQAREDMRIEDVETEPPEEIKRKRYIKDIGIGISIKSRISEFTDRRQ